MTRQSGKQEAAEVWLESHEALLDLNTERLENAVVTDNEPEVKLPIQHYLRYKSNGSKGPGVYCSCGAKKIHHRGKPLVAWAKKHIAKTGHIWKAEQ